MKNFPHPDNKHLEAAEGWLELGNCLEANEELEKIAPKLRAHPFVLELRYLKDLFARLPAAKISAIKQFTPVSWGKRKTGRSASLNEPAAAEN